MSDFKRAKEWQANHMDRVREYARHMCRIDRRRLKLEAFAAYTSPECATGPECACCGEDTVDFLTIDHINGGGNEHRRQMNGTNPYRWLKKHGYPPGYQVLCFNCNCGRRINGGICPHKDTEFTLERIMKVLNVVELGNTRANCGRYKRKKRGQPEPGQI